MRENKKILILDDEDAIRHSFMDYFQDQQWQVIGAESGEEGLRLLKEEVPQCVIVDIRLKRMDGNTFIVEAYRLKPSTVFVICTGSTEFSINSELKNITWLSQTMFSKPVVDISVIENELLRLLKLQKESMQDEK